MEDEWEREKEKILNSLLGSGQDVLELPTQNEVQQLYQLATYITY